MAIDNFDTWRNELILTGKLFQDNGVSPENLEQDEKQTKRYVELVEMAEGVNEQRVFRALIDSLQVDDDYEVYETTVGVVMSFPPKEFGLWLVEALPSLIVRQPERAGDLLSLMVNNTRLGDNRIIDFKYALQGSPETIKNQIFSFIRQQEENGWLKNKKGWYDA